MIVLYFKEKPLQNAEIHNFTLDQTAVFYRNWSCFESCGTEYLIITQVQPYLYYTIFSRKSHGVTDFIIKKKQT